MNKLVCAVLLLLSNSASAALVTWTFDTTLYSDLGTEIVGSFVFDADTDTYSDVNITTTSAEPGLDGFALALVNPASSDNWLDLIGQFPMSSPGDYITISINPSLTNAGGVVNYDSVMESKTYADYTGGTLIGTVVPVPAAVWLFGSALAGLGWLRRKPI